MAPFILKFKARRVFFSLKTTPHFLSQGNKSFVAFHNMNDGDSLTKTWKVCTKVAAHLEQGQRLENLSWRLWHLHNIMVESDNAKSKREFKKLSRTMGDKLDKEKGKNIEELRAPGYKRTQSSDKFRRRAEELERLRQNAHTGGGMRRMQFTFSLDAPSPSQAATTKPKLSLTSIPVKKPNVFKEPAPKVDSSTTKNTNATATSQQQDSQGKRSSAQSPWNEGTMAANNNSSSSNSNSNNNNVNSQWTQDRPMTDSSVRLPGIFSNNFGPTALLYPSPSFTPSNTYGEDVTMSYAGTDSSPNGGMGVSRPTIELPLDELLDVDDSPNSWDELLASIDAAQSSEDRDADMLHNSTEDYIDSGNGSNEEKKPFDVNMELLRMLEADRLLAASVPSQTQTPATTLNPMTLLNSPVVANGSAISTSTRASNAPGATVVPVSTPAGTKTECSNCGATHTPLWRRGLNDELNCNACGLYCKLHKRPRPKTMRTSTGESIVFGSLREQAYNFYMLAKCFNCSTTATPLWRKDDEGKTVCNAYVLFVSLLHGTNRPMSMKSDVVRKRTRHVCRVFALNGTIFKTASFTSPGTSRRASPARASSPQPSVTEDDRQDEQRTPQFSYDYTTPSPRSVYGTKESSSSNDMLTSVSTQDQTDDAGDHTLSAYAGFFPGPYHPDFLYQLTDLHPIQTGESSAYSVEDRGNKRRRLSSASYDDSATTPTDPPPSATSMNSASHRSPTSSPRFSPYGLPYQSIYSSYQSFDETSAPWMKTDSEIHAPKRAPDDAPMEYLHPPMVLPSESASSSQSSYAQGGEDATMSYLHPPMLPQANSPIVGYSHPPMLPSYWSNQSSSDYDSSSNANDNSSAMEMFDSILQPMD
ncbi:hypothetical protein BU17DRAFT_47869 [Hysterangium stoloniferum]|nr:hypothetical protein BU17DRAFT_47869 [Hysterangium stoloniferum]